MKNRLNLVLYAFFSIHFCTALNAEQTNASLQDAILQAKRYVVAMGEKDKGCKSLSDIKLQLKGKPESADLFADIEDFISKHCSQKPPLSSMTAEEEKALLDAITLFYKANYEGALKRLRGLVGSSPHSPIAMALAHFYVGACSASQFFYTGDAQKLSAAKTSFRESKKFFGNAQPPLKWISSRIMKIYQEP